MSIVLFVLLTGLIQQGKVVVQAGLAGAEFYLDGNLVAKTDENGALTMESFPAGSFKFLVKKEGYKPYEGSFKIGEGESKLLRVQLSKIKIEGVAPPPKPALEATVTKTRSARSKPDAADKTEIKLPPSPPTKPAPAQAPQQTASASSNEVSISLWPWIFLIAAVLAGGGYWFWHRKGRIQQLPPPFIEENPEEPAPQAPKPAPEFIDELRRKEELLNAGFVGEKRREINLGQVRQKEKDIVIVLPKEAYRYEEDK